MCIRDSIAQRDELAEHAAPGRLVQVGADAEYTELGMVPGGDAIGRLAAHDIDEVQRAEALSGAVDARKRLARRIGGVPGLGRIDACLLYTSDAADERS